MSGLDVKMCENKLLKWECWFRGLGGRGRCAALLRFKQAYRHPPCCFRKTGSILSREVWLSFSFGIPGTLESGHVSAFFP